MMVDDLKNILLAGIGTAAYSYEKACEIVNTMVKKGQLSVDQGKELSQELKKTLNDTAEKTNDKTKSLTREDMIDVLKQMNFATKDEVADIKERLEKLEKKADNE